MKLNFYLVAWAYYRHWYGNARLRKIFSLISETLHMSIPPKRVAIVFRRLMAKSSKNYIVVMCWLIISNVTPRNQMTIEVFEAFDRVQSVRKFHDFIRFHQIFRPSSAAPLKTCIISELHWKLTNRGHVTPCDLYCRDLGASRTWTRLQGQW